MGMRCSGKCGMAMLIFINVIFALLGIGLLVVGILLRFNTDTLFEDEVVALLEEVTLYGAVSLGALLKSMSLYVIILGACMLAFALLGALAACCRSRCLLWMYGILLVIAFIGTGVCLGFWIHMRDEIESDIKQELLGALDKYDGPDSEVMVSQGIDTVQIKLKCCGCTSVKKDDGDTQFNGSIWYKNKRKNLREKIPTSCCKNANKDNYKTLVNAKCQEDLEDHNDKGCNEAIAEEADTYELAVIIVLVVALAIELLAILFACCLCSALKKDKMII